jgi:hypothetical protein
MNNEHVEHEVGLLVKAIERLGTKGADGKATVKYHEVVVQMYIKAFF